ncbi:TetR/AcrR family transcriptional regulator [Thalassobacter stenotrophicus]|uniref:Bacterial regulatory proteins, tetR family n=3 Tax=Thalassobacter stenotrophicus TaxID=266809 RepID=A0A0P1EV03_9RHOB|nr:TetR/AcrR family transcriptional regulator [Thalassobacter stenotrophicus]CUH58827.1 Bacterial regulatory proteins, tetR family [Thalassobacter stenotrophicus]SHJ35658.1 transcriptional regulator, TetR family [Thalassobacter stenotrophicus DSM 16310]
MDILVSNGVQDVKIMKIGAALGVSRSSFYWYFKSREDLLDQLLAEWERTNTGILIHHANLPAATITEALCNFFICVVRPEGFNYQLDFAVREWSRRDPAVRAVIDRSDTARTDALRDMFARYDYSPAEADIRARVLYYQQIGYYALELSESLDIRLSRLPGYLLAFTGQSASTAEIEAFRKAIA